MTVNASTRRAGPFAGTGVIVAYPFEFKVFAKEDLKVVQVDDATSVSTDLVLDSGYSVTLNVDQDADPGGSIAYLVGGVPTALPAGQSLTAVGNLPYEQPTDITNQGGFYPQVIEDALDRNTMLIQQVGEIAERALVIPIGDTATTQLPNAASRANNLMGFDSDGNVVAVTPTSGSVLDFASNLLNTTLAALGDALVGVKRVLTGAIGRTLHAWVETTPPTPQDFGAVGDDGGATNCDAAFALWATAIAGKTGILPNGTYKLTTGIAIAANTTIKGHGKHSAILDWYGTGPCLRSVGTVNVAGANRIVLEDMQVRAKGNASPGIQDCMALLWGGLNILNRVKLTWDGVNRPRYCLVADQQALLSLDGCDLEGFSAFGLIGPNNGELPAQYTGFGVSTGSYITVLKLNNCQVNSDAASAVGIACDRGQVAVIDGACNFNGIHVPVRFGDFSAVTVARNYFERTSGTFNAATNHGPAVLFANTSAIAGAALTVTNRFCATVGPDNHIEMQQNNKATVTSANEGMVEVNGGFVGVLNVIGNEMSPQASHAVYVRSGACTRINYHDNYYLYEGVRTGLTKGVYVETGASANVHESDARRVAYPSTVKALELGGHKIMWASALPTAIAGSALEGETVAPGDLVILESGASIQQVTVGGTFGAAQASTCTTVATSDEIVLAGSDGTLLEGGQITIAGVAGIKTIKQIFVSAADGLRHVKLDSACNTSGAARAITYQPVTFHSNT